VLTTGAGEQEEQEEVTGWKLVHGDVFRPPKRGWLLAVMVGTGVQFLGAVLTTIRTCASRSAALPSPVAPPLLTWRGARAHVCRSLSVWVGGWVNDSVFATIGVLNPSYRGGMASFAVFLFVFMGCAA
jgi:transmembrane 9 superfamily member 2/4